VEKLVRVEEVKKSYFLGKVEVPALRGVSFEVAKGEFISITGPSGCGKSTLMHLIGCLDHPTSGRIYLEEKDVTQLGDEELAKIRNEKIGFVFQAFNLLPRLTALENVELPLVYGNFSPQKMREKALATLEKVGLAHRAQHHPTELSGGECQRVAIARALVVNPLLILADEPTGNLDSKASEEIIIIFKKLNQEGVTIIVVTHEKEIASHTRRQIHLRDGKIISDEIAPQTK